MDCHCSNSQFKQNVVNFKNLIRKTFEVLKLIFNLEDTRSLKSVEYYCTVHMRLPINQMPDLFFKSLCLYFEIRDDECFRIVIKHSKNDHCQDNVLSFLYNLQTFMGSYPIESQGIVKRFADLSIDTGSFGEDLTTAVNLNSKNIHLLVQNQRNLNLGQRALIDEVNKIFEAGSIINSSNYGKILSDLVFGSKVIGSLHSLHSQFERAKQQISLATYTLNKFLNVQINLLKGSAASAFNQQFCFLYNEIIGCSQNQPNVIVSLSSITWKYHLEKVIVSKSTKFSCVPSKAGISKKNGQLLLSTSNDRRHQLLSNGHLLVLGNDDEEKENFNSISDSSVLQIGNCYYNIANVSVLISCNNRATLTIANGTLFNVQAFELKLIDFASFPIIVNSLHLDLDSLVKSIQSKQFELNYLNSKEKIMISRKGLPVLIDKKKKSKKLESKPLMEIISQNYPSFTYFSVTTAVLTLIGILLTCACCFKFKDTIYGMIRYLYLCCITNGRPHLTEEPHPEPANENLLQGPSAPSLPAITDQRT